LHYKALQSKFSYKLSCVGNGEARLETRPRSAALFGAHVVIKSVNQVVSSRTFEDFRSIRLN